MFVYGLIGEIVMLVVDKTDSQCALCAEPLQVRMISSLETLTGMIINKGSLHMTITQRYNDHLTNN